MKSHDLQKLYSLTLKKMALSELQERALLQEFCSFFQQSSWFPAFLREKGQPQNIYQMADLEWNLAEQKNAEAVANSVTLHNKMGAYQLNPLTRFCILQEAVPELGFSDGVYAFCGDKMLKLNAQQAKFLDQLQEEMMLTFDMEKNLEELLEHGVILEMK